MNERHADMGEQQRCGLTLGVNPLQLVNIIIKYVRALQDFPEKKQHISREKDVMRFFTFPKSKFF